MNYAPEGHPDHCSLCRKRAALKWFAEGSPAPAVLAWDDSDHPEDDDCDCIHGHDPKCSKPGVV